MTQFQRLGDTGQGVHDFDEWVLTCSQQKSHSGPSGSHLIDFNSKYKLK